MGSQAHGGHPAAASRPGTVSYKFITTTCTGGGTGRSSRLRGPPRLVRGDSIRAEHLSFAFGRALAIPAYPGRQNGYAQNAGSVDDWPSPHGESRNGPNLERTPGFRLEHVTPRGERPMRHGTVMGTVHVMPMARRRQHEQPQNSDIGNEMFSRTHRRRRGFVLTVPRASHESAITIKK